MVEYDSYRVRPSCFVEVLPGIPEESEHESECEIDRDMQLKSDSKLRVDRQEESRRRRFEKRKKGRGKNALVPAKTVKPFAYTLFVANVTLRIADQLGIAIVVSLLPSLAERLLPDFRMQEKAFLMSLCGFSRVIAELPLILSCKSPTRTKIVVLFGPLLASIGLYRESHVRIYGARTILCIDFLPSPQSPGFLRAWIRSLWQALVSGSGAVRPPPRCSSSRRGNLRRLTTSLTSSLASLSWLWFLSCVS